MMGLFREKQALFYRHIVPVNQGMGIGIDSDLKGYKGEFPLS
jgi:hypothetical protein